VQQYLADGGHPRDLMRLVGWKSRQLPARYGGSEPSDGRRGERLAFSLGDRL